MSKQAQPDGTPSTFKKTLIRVLVVQAIALAVLALLQLTYNV